MPDRASDIVPPDGASRLGILSSWNIRCGIAEYCRYLAGAIRAEGVPIEILSDRRQTKVREDESFVCRPWENTGETAPHLVSAVGQRRLSDLLVQYHPGFYPPVVLGRVIDELSHAGVRVWVIHHATYHEDLPKIASSLSRAAANFVHHQSDVRRLNGYGVVNVSLFPHPIYVPPDSFDSSEAAGGRDGFCIGGFGFLMPHKGFLELIAASYLLRRHIPNLRVRIYAPVYPLPASEKLLSRCRAFIRYLQCSDIVTLDTEFREVDDLVARLRQCDLLIFPYQCSQESASGAVRMALAARRPVLCTPLAIFDDIKPLVHFATGFDAFALGDKIMELYWNQKQLHEHDALRDHYLDTHSFSSLARALLRIIEMQPPLAQVPLEQGAVA